MTTPARAERRRPRLLVFVVGAWVAAAGLAIGGTFAPLFVETESPSTPSSSSSTSSSDFDPSSDEDRGSSFEITAWDQNNVVEGRERDSQSPATMFGLPIVIAAAVLLTGGLIGTASVLTGSDPGLRWSTTIAGVGAAVLLGAVGTVGMVVKSLSDGFDKITTTVGASDYFDVDASVGKGMWLLLTGAVLGAAAAVVAVIARRRIGPGWHPPAPEPEPVEDEAPATPSFGVPVIRPVGYD